MAESPQPQSWTRIPMSATRTITSDDELMENPSPLIQRSPAPHPMPLVLRPSSPSNAKALTVASTAISNILHSLLPTCTHPPSLPISPSSRRNRRRLTGTLFGPRKGRVTFSLQQDPGSPPNLLLELPFQTSHLIQEMAGGTVRILLECEKAHDKKLAVALWEEPVWTMYCNGRRSGYAVSRKWGENDQHVFKTVGTVSAGAGVLPPMSPMVSAAGAGVGAITASASPACVKAGYGGDESLEMMFMRAKFERVVGSKDSEAFYMMSPDGGGGGGGPELSIFLLRL